MVSYREAVSESYPEPANKALQPALALLVAKSTVESKKARTAAGPVAVEFFNERDFQKIEEPGRADAACHTVSRATRPKRPVSTHLASPQVSVPARCRIPKLNMLQHQR